MNLILVIAAKDVVNELECLVNDASAALRTSSENLANLQHEDTSHVLDVVATTYDKVVSWFYYLCYVGVYSYVCFFLLFIE